MKSITVRAGARLLLCRPPPPPPPWPHPRRRKPCRCRRKTLVGTARDLVPSERDAAVAVARSYRCFVDTRKDERDRGGSKPVYYCLACGFKSDRLHRLIGHQRSKRGHRPLRAQIKAVMYTHTLSPRPPPPLGSQDQLLICPFRVVTFADTLRRVWVIIEALEMA